MERWKISELITPACVVSLTNVVFGAFSLLASIAGFPGAAARFIILSFIADSLDGFVARRTGKESEFGMNLDSLADLVSFAVAPAVLVVTAGLVPAPMCYLLAVLMVCCGALRLARFNAMCVDGYDPGEYYLGLPVPWVGTIASSLYFLTVDLGPSYLWYVLNTVILGTSALLMISSIKFPSLKRPHPAILAAGGLSSLVLLFSFLIPPDEIKRGLEVVASVTITALLSWYMVRGVRGCFRGRR
ncbi:CDP-diacylglycerol--serine O-phosphatidyltransferase [Methanopyrus kandleri]|uniref:CDP-diacylglycerol--serine O-phosphatidyltransferase n=2 Tax=Methanopyrus kandleri TaxID=2320 RepID=Q8TYY0_METKA|nr:CDP-diacylglycerol--serine O-phosphatidyltransferase [Methanopyrus kandleri]AAM01378.1 Phosphatidylserine synthase [Methanopyrus kandleri AV19]HII70698.1 CDP-diacylglycerol--serine O-phosphatidyltransferase [Methanopyrus kandleri]